MSGRFFRMGVWIILTLSIAYFTHSCYRENQDIQIDQVGQPKKWVYDIVTVPLGERMYYVFIDGELDQDAVLEAQTQILHLNKDRPDSIYTSAWFMKLPKGKFSFYYNRDDSGPETFIYRPFKATKGWVRIQISPGQWTNKDSKRSQPIWLQSNKVASPRH